MPKTKLVIAGDAKLSADGLHRYWLTRDWSNGEGKQVCFVMLNPSTADASKDDATIRRCIGFARAWGFGRLIVRNLYTFRATDPRQLRNQSDRYTGGSRGLKELRAAVESDLIVVAWGSHMPARLRAHVAAKAFRGHRVWCLGVGDKWGQPKHPLRLPADLTPLPWSNEGWGSGLDSDDWRP